MPFVFSNVTVRYLFKGLPAILPALLIFFPASGQINAEAPITIDYGLVNNEVTAIHQDKYGFLWFGTRGGLNKYDGYDFNVIRDNPNSNNNLSNQAVEVIAEGRNQVLWIGTKNGGLNSYNLLKDSIVHYHPPGNVKIQEIKALAVDKKGVLYIGALHGLYKYEGKNFFLIDDQITVNAITVDKEDRIWIGSTIGLFLYDKAAGKLKNIRLEYKGPNITSIAVDDTKSLIYLGTWGAGLIVFDMQSGHSSQFVKGRPGTADLGTNNTYRVFLDRSHDLWVGTWGGGLYRFDTQNGSFKQVNIKPQDVHNTDYDIVLSIEQDLAGIIWIGTDGGGICRVDPFRKEFHTIVQASGNSGLKNTHITAVFEDTTGGLWIGTRGDGLNYSRDKKVFVRIAKDWGGPIVRAFYEDNSKDLWVGTSRGLLIFEDYYHNRERPLLISRGNDDHSLSGPKVTAIVRDKENIFWVGTQEHGLNRVIGYDQGKPIFKKYPELVGVPGALQNDRISCMLVDRNNRLWIGTYDGLHLYDRTNDRFVLFRHDNRDSNSISNNTILSLAEDRQGALWIGTQRGVNRLFYRDKQGYTFTRYFQSPGFPNDYIHSLVIDHNDNVWMSTNSGITKLDVKGQYFRNFDKRDGVASNTYSENASYRASDGQVFFGGISGVTYFYPDSIRPNRYQPAIYITDLKINNKDVVVGQALSNRTILSQSLFLTDKIRLSYKEDIISLSFSALDYHAPDRNQYQYQLVGFDKNWVNAGTRRTVTYTNLPAGTYTFQIRASNSDQIWNTNGQKMEITILPPPWKTWWAYTIYALVILGLLGFSRYITLSRIRLRNELQIADLNYKKEHEIAELKGKFFANISHEFRTPLTLMLGPLEGIAHSLKVDPSIKNVLKKVNHQSKRLLSLVNQLLDFNKAENDALKLNAGEVEVVSLMKNVFESFIDEAERKNIRYSFESNKEPVCIHGDKDKLESIGYNLLSNAFKFTPKGGEISLRLLYREDRSEVDLVFTDSGKGISSAEKEKVFDRFYQVAQNEPGKYTGTGIGLAFVKDLVELHQGKISIEDGVPQGSVFRISLPALDAHKSLKNTALSDTPEFPIPPVRKPEKQEDLSLILVVEDNDELNHYISETLGSVGTVISAFDGDGGFAKACETIPDLVVSDIMMPGLNGFELCRALKTDIKTSHIPVILLTAKSDDQSHIEGMDVGADNYLAKPFNPAVLASNAVNLIETRKKLKELFALRFSLEPAQLEIPSSDEAFIRKAVSYTEENISVDDFSIDELAGQLNMSRSTFYRKLKALTGMSGSDFIRMIKLKRSAQLLRSGEYSVSTAAFEAGFNDLKHFRKSFAQQFGMTPSEYLKQETAKSLKDPG